MRMRAATASPTMHVYGAVAAQSPVMHVRRIGGGRLFPHYVASSENVE
jgi:hypothetical protein